MEVITRVEVIYKDSKAIIGVEPEYKWGEVYRMISSQTVPYVGFSKICKY